jgi:acyl carrier protein
MIEVSDNNIEQEITSIISDVSGFDLDEINPETNLANDLEVDSIKAIEITVAIEKKYKISIRDEDIQNITTVQQAFDITKNLIAQKED